jgi:hypothetical protein
MIIKEGGKNTVYIRYHETAIRRSVTFPYNRYYDTRSGDFDAPQSL